MDKNSQPPGEHLPAATQPRSEETGLLREIQNLSGRDIVRALLELDDPREAVRQLSQQDFYWIVKKVGDQDAVMLLEMASEEQWQYLLDLETWNRDRIDVTETGAWLERFEQADGERLVKWLFTEGEYLTYYHLYRSLEVIIVEDQEQMWEIPDDFFSLDGVYYFRSVDPEQRPSLERLLRVMAEEDSLRFQSLVLGLAGVLPGDLEEELYRRRNVRLAEHGFLPYEEALAIYAPLDPHVLEAEYVEFLPQPDLLKEEGVSVPSVPLQHVDAGNLLLEIVSSLPDPELIDRVRVEFAGLCNQILSADRALSPELEDLIQVCRKAASYVNLGLESVSGKSRPAAEKALKGHSLVSFFRVGFGLALKIKWEAERWLKTSWFGSHGLRADFWGEYWGGVLAAVTEPRPRFFVGKPDGEETREFEWLSDLVECLSVIRRIMVLDGLLARLAEIYHPEPQLFEDPELTFRPFLFNLWARRTIKAGASFSPLSLVQAGRFMEMIREWTGQPESPSSPTGGQDEFLNFFVAFAGDPDGETLTILKEALALVLQEFLEEYRLVSPGDMDARYSKFITISGEDETQ